MSEWTGHWQIGDVCIPKVPMPGMLYGGRDNGTWHVMGRGVGYGGGIRYFNTDGGGPVVIIGQDNSHAPPLLPSPAQLIEHGLTAWDGIGLIGHINPDGMDCYVINYHPGFCSGRFYRNGRSSFIVASRTLWDAEYTVLAPAIQKHTAILEWYAQFEEAHDEH